MRICVVVLGDLGRSPRMQYHCCSLADRDDVSHVYFVGNSGESCVQALERNVKIEKVMLPPMKKNSTKLYKAFAQTVNLTLALLFSCGSVEYYLVQNPPALSLPIVYFACLFKGGKVVVDWHNLGYSILKLSVDVGLIVWLARLFEKLFSRFAHAHLCVTKAMKEYLTHDFGIEAGRITVVYDKPPNHFYPRSLFHQVAIWDKLEIDPKSFKIVTSTSYTPDENLQILLDALELMKRQIKEDQKLTVVVTGKGPLREQFEAKISEMNIRNVTIQTHFLSLADYAALLGSFDVGVCLHTSSSGLDLPMKVLDFQGSGLAVCAVGFKCLDELVVHEANGLVFTTPLELAKHLLRLLNEPDLGHGLIENTKVTRWDENWNSTARQVFPNYENKTGYSRILIFIVAVLAILTLPIFLPSVSQLRTP